MHSLSLYAQIPSSRHVQALNILAGLTGTQPRETYTYTQVIAPIRAASDSNTISKKSTATNQHQQQQLSYVQLEAELPHSAFQSSSTIQTPDEAANLQYTVTTQDTPEPETRNLILRRTVTEPQPLSAPAAKARFSDEAKYKLVVTLSLHSNTDLDRHITSVVHEGHIFIHHDIILRLRRVLCFPPSADPGLEGPLFALDTLVLLDASGGWTLEASVRIDDRGKPALVRAASEQLLALQRELKGAIELRVPERLSMDTRVRA